MILDIQLKVGKSILGIIIYTAKSGKSIQLKVGKFIHGIKERELREYTLLTLLKGRNAIHGMEN